MTPGQQAYQGYLEQAGGRSLATGDKLPKFSDLNAEIRAAWEAAAANVGPLREINGVTASQCQFGAQESHHTALRFVWHHILPQVCGGKAVQSNLAELCDNCHYAVHNVMYALSRGATPSKAATADQFTLAQTGYQLAVKAGTQGKIPKESAG